MSKYIGALIEINFPEPGVKVSGEEASPEEEAINQELYDLFGENNIILDWRDDCCLWVHFQIPETLGGVKVSHADGRLYGAISKDE